MYICMCALGHLRGERLVLTLLLAANAFYLKMSPIKHP